MTSCWAGTVLPLSVMHCGTETMESRGTETRLM